MEAILKYKKICSIVSMYQRLFVTTRNGIFIGTPFMFIGMAIKKYNKYFFKIPDITLTLLLLIGLVMNAIEALKLYMNFGNSINNPRLFTAMPCEVTKSHIITVF